MALKPARPASIRGRLVRTMFIAALLAFVAAAAGLLLFDRLTLENRARAIVEPYAQLVSVGAEAAVVFGDAQRAQEILDGLRASAQIRTAQIVLADGRVLARHGSGTPPPLARDPGLVIAPGGDVAEYVQALGDGAALQIVLDLRTLQQAGRGMLLAAGAAMVVLLAAVTLGLLAALQRGIVRPISALAGAVDEVRVSADYTQRVPAAGSDELARLGDGFNAMMAALQSRDEALHRLTALQRTILDNVGSAIVSTTPDGIVTSFNPAAERLFGRTAVDVVGRLTPAAWHDSAELARRAEALSAELGERIEPGTEVFIARPRRGLPEIGDYTVLRPDGTRVPVHVTVTALRNEAGVITGFVGLATDLTERMRAEEALRRHKDELEATVRQRTIELEVARDAAEAASRSKSAFLANMSHEIRTPMNAILGMSDLALRSGLPSQQEAYVRKAHDAAEALLGILNDILDFSKIEAGRLDLETIPFALQDVLEKVTSMVGMKAEHSGVELLLDVPPRLPSTLRGDPSRLGQVLLNLAGNAVKFTHRGEVVISVRLLDRQAASVTLGFEVEDTGVGIAPELQERLFEPFAQGDASTSRRFGGTGLGLTISNHLVRLMGGQLNVDSKPGGGSRFGFVLRLGCDAAAPDPEDNASLRGLRMLVVDDNARARELLARMARALGLEAVTVDDASAALRLVAAADAAQQPHALVLFDARMPGIDGASFAQSLMSASLRRRPALVLTTCVLARHELQQHLSPGAGAPVLLDKPVMPAALAAACRAALVGAQPKPAGKAAPRKPLRTDLAGTRVLLVEDNEINREIAMALLDGAGMVVECARDGREALRMLGQATFHVVLMDCQMPEMDGYDATRALRAQPHLRDLPVIAMTANAMVGDRDLALAAGMNDHIAKPIRADEMLDTLARWLQPAARPS